MAKSRLTTKLMIDVVYGGSFSDPASTLPRLTDLIAGNLLVPGKYYRITDFQTTHVINGVDEIHRGLPMPIIVEAQTTNTLMPTGTIDNNHTDIITYDRTQEIMPGANTNWSVMLAYTNWSGSLQDGVDQGWDITTSLFSSNAFTINRDLLVDGNLSVSFSDPFNSYSLTQTDLTPQTYNFQSYFNANAWGHQQWPIITPTGQWTFTISNIPTAPVLWTFNASWMNGWGWFYAGIPSGYTVTETAPGSKIWIVEITDTVTYANYNALDAGFELTLYFDATFTGRSIVPSMIPGTRDVTIDYPVDLTSSPSQASIQGGNMATTTNGTIPITITGLNTFTIPFGTPIDINQYFGLSVSDSVNSYYLTVADFGTGFTYDSMTGLFTILAGPIDLTDVSGYNVDINNTLVLWTRPGWITYRKNLLRDIEATYDYENCVTRLRAIDTATMFPMYVPWTLYTKWQLVTDGSYFYICTQNTTWAEAPWTNNYWMWVIDPSTASMPMLSYPGGGTYGWINFLGDANTWKDYYVLHNAYGSFDISWTTHFKDLNPNGMWLMTNNVFLGSTWAPQINNVTMIGTWNFFAKRQYLNLHLENMSANLVPQQWGMINNTALNIASSLFMGALNNTNIQQVTSSAILGNGFTNVTVIGGIDNSILSWFDNTVVNGNINQCTIWGTTNRNNIIGTLQEDNYYSGIEESTILNSSLNVFNAKVFECVITKLMTQCIVPDNLGAAFGNVTALCELNMIDFTWATHIYLWYSKETLQRPDGQLRIRYLDNTDNINIDIVTA